MQFGTFLQNGTLIQQNANSFNASTGIILGDAVEAEWLGRSIETRVRPDEPPLPSSIPMYLFGRLWPQGICKIIKKYDYYYYLILTMGGF